MKLLFPILLMLTYASVTVAAEAKTETKNNEAVINDIIESLYEKDAPECYHFTDEVPPEEFIGLPECNLTPSKLTGSVELGAFFYTGDNENALAKTRADLAYEVGKLRTSYLVDLYIRKSREENEDGDKEYETTDQKWQAAIQSNYTLEEGGKNYIFGFFGYEDDRFNGFDYQASFAGGWGRRWIEDEISFLDAEIGPGLKVDEVKETDDHNNQTEKAVIIRAASTYERKLFESIVFKQVVSAEMAPKSGENSKYKAITSFTTKLIESLALKFAFTLDYNTEVEGDTSHSRTETSLTLVYSI